MYPHLSKNNNEKNKQNNIGIKLDRHYVVIGLVCLSVCTWSIYRNTSHMNQRIRIEIIKAILLVVVY